VWAHHKFVVGLGMIPEAFFGATSLLIAVPTGVKIFSWLGTMWGGQIRFTTAMLYAVGLIAMFTVGGISGVHFALVPIDWQTHDTYYVVAHFHYVLYFGSWFGVQAGTYYWLPKMTGRLLDERLGRLSFWIELVGANLTFFPMHVLGLMGMPRRVYTYPDIPGWGELNLLQTLGTGLQAVGLLIFIWNVWRSQHSGEPAGDNPWDGATLEWATSSPPPSQNFREELPPIHSPTPLWDLRSPLPTRGALPDQGRQAGQQDEPPQTLGHAGGFLERLTPPGLGMASFVTSDVTLFGAFVFSFVYFRTSDPRGPDSSVLNVPLTALFSLALFVSSFTLIRAERLLQRGDQAGFVRWMLATAALGAIFLGGQLFEYTRLVGEGITIDRNSFTSSFYTLTGAHGTHVLVGLVLLSALAWTGSRGDFRDGTRHGAIQAISIYWHFVDIVWVAVFSIVYLWALVG
jgi:heme/copper-type cytochrome/quinol oxidase subunit 3